MCEEFCVKLVQLASIVCRHLFTENDVILQEDIEHID